MNPTAIRQKERSGSAMPLALLAVAVLLIMGTGVLRLGLSGRIFAIRASSDIIARAAADAALTTALFAMNEKLATLPWDDDDLPFATDQHLAGTNATFSYTITGNLSSGYVVEAIGKSGEAVRQVSAALRLRGPFDAAVFAKGLLNMNNAGTIDWYNNDADDFNFAVSTGSTEENSITLKSGVTINGDLVVGVGGDPDVVIESKEDLTVEGRIYALSDAYATPPVSVPEAIDSLLSSGTIDGETQTIESSGKYSSINLKNGEKVTISGDVTLYITGDITLGNSAELHIEEDSSLTLYLGGNFEGKNSNGVNNETKDPESLQIYGLESCAQIQLKNGTDLFGAIYAPNADVIINNSANVYGAVVSKTFDMKNSGVFMYDASLRDTSVSDPIVRFILKRWSE